MRGGGPLEIVVSTCVLGGRTGEPPQEYQRNERNRKRILFLKHTHHILINLIRTPKRALEFIGYVVLRFGRLLLWTDETSVAENTLLGVVCGRRCSLITF